MQDNAWALMTTKKNTWRLINCLKWLTAWTAKVSLAIGNKLLFVWKHYALNIKLKPIKLSLGAKTCHMLERIGLARYVFYYHLKRLNNTDGYDAIRKRIKSVYDENRGSYGYRRFCYALRNEGMLINHKTVLKLMRQLDLEAKRKRRHYTPIKAKWAGLLQILSTGISMRLLQIRSGRQMSRKYAYMMLRHTCLL